MSTDSIREQWTPDEQAERVAEHSSCKAGNPLDSKGRCVYCVDDLHWCGAVAAVEGAILVGRERANG